LFCKGTVIFREFEPGKMGYIVNKGQVRLVKLNPFLKEESTLAILGPGEIFGELALLGSSKRIATAIADTDDTELLMFDEQNFVAMLQNNPDFCMKILRICCKRIKEMDDRFELS
ncbi:MAG: cyclic nucleotide-binding domain-containing protein, partial [Candidatus Wallbacteria bacterium]|nr:cyclic nucleotide-binding domain-containing protein [Candidatus Wallbacteria bacterium]